VVKGVSLREPVAVKSVKLRPKNKAREVHMYRGYFHKGSR
jgi:hypothetical protein